MKIWILKRGPRYAWFDDFDGFCVVAPSAERAREMTNKYAKEHQDYLWQTAKDVTTTLIGEACENMVESIVLASNVGAEPNPNR